MDRQPTTSTIKYRHLSSPKIVGFNVSFKTDRFSDQCRDLCDSGTDVKAPAATRQLPHKSLGYLRAQSQTRLPLLPPEFIASFVTVDAAEFLVIKPVEDLTNSLCGLRLQSMFH